MHTRLCPKGVLATNSVFTYCDWSSLPVCTLAVASANGLVVSLVAMLLTSLLFDHQNLSFFMAALVFRVTIRMFWVVAVASLYHFRSSVVWLLRWF